MDNCKKKSIFRGEIYDPFTVELILNALQLAVTIIGTYISYQGLSEQKNIKSNTNKDRDIYLAPFRSLLDQTLRLHVTLDDIIMVVGRNNMGAGNTKPRLKNGELYFNDIEYIRYSRIERSITELLNDARELSAQVRRISLDFPLSAEYNYLDRSFAKDFDDLLDDFSNLTFAEIFKKLRDILKNLEADLKNIIHRNESSES